MELTDVNGGAVDAERGKERLHDDRCRRDDEPADDRQLACIGVAAPNCEAPADDAHGSKDEPDEHNNAQRFAGATGKIARSLREDWNELITKKCFHVPTFYRVPAATLLQRESDLARTCWQAIPMNGINISAEDLERLHQLEPHLRAQILGQDQVISRVVAALHRAELGLSASTRPRGSFLLLGPTGVGKTELTLAFTDYLLGKDKLFRFDMSEYQTQESLAVLIGGRVGEIGLLGLAREKSDIGTLLFDEIEKAHPRVFDLFLQMLDAARVTMASGDTLDLSSFYIVFTSNIAASDILNLQHSSFATMERHVLARAQQSLRPELYARINEKLVFNRLSYDVQMEIARLHVARELTFLRSKGFELSADESVISFVMQRGFHPRLGARPLRDTIEKHLRGAVVTATLQNEMPSRGSFRLSDNRLIVAPCDEPLS